MAGRITNEPLLSWILVAITYVGLGVLIVLFLGDGWSGQGSLLALFQLLVAPVVMGIVAERNYRKWAVSDMHRWAAYASAGYFIVLLLLFVGIVLRMLTGS